MPRRILNYPEAFWYWNWLASIGACISYISLLLFFVIIYDAFTQKVNFFEWRDLAARFSLKDPENYSNLRFRLIIFSPDGKSREVYKNKLDYSENLPN